MISIYCEDNWPILQQEKECGMAKKYQYTDCECEIEYSFIMRKAGIINNVQYYDILTPRGMGGPRYKKEGAIKLTNYNEDFLSYCKKNNIIAEYVRFDPWNRNHSIFGSIYDSLEHYGNLYCNTLNSNFFKEEYNKGVRSAIKKNRKEIEVKFDFEGKSIDKFLELYRYTEEKYMATDYYRISKTYLFKYFQLLKGRVAVANAIYKDNIVSSSIILFGKDIVHYHFSGNNPLYRTLNANTVLLYETALLAQNMGKKLFDLGGGIIGGNTANYKKHFVNDKGVYPYYIGKRILDEEVYKKLILKNGRNRPGYFPEYKRLDCCDF